MSPASPVPIYKLYGEHKQWLTPDMVHCESIADRSKLHNWHIKPHQHAGLFQILYLKAGTASVQIDDERKDMHPGEVLLVPQGCVHGFRFEDDAQGVVMTLAYPLLIRLSQGTQAAQATDGGVLHLTRPYQHRIADDEEGLQLKSMIEAFHREYRSHALYRNALMETLLSALLLWLSRHAANGQGQRQGHALTENGKGAKHFHRFCELVERSYDKHYHVDHYAREIGITAAHLNMLCRQASEKSALELIHDRLLLEAKRNLVYTSMSISEVSYAVGFADPAYFTRFFKRLAGMSPKEFREQAENLHLNP
jgi:AraC family transcriptional regulator, transcriptional activator of pobA